jgi:large subunit ribosomal protein L23
MAIFGDKKKEGAKKEAKVRTSRVRHARAARLPDGAAHDIIRAPWFSEQALLGTEKGTYVFAVAPRATKAQVAGAIKEIYSVSPKAVRIVNLPGKKKALRTRRGVGVRAARTKAYVQLNAGDTIELA